MVFRESVPVKKISRNSKNWWSPHIAQMIKEKNSLKRKLKKIENANSNTNQFWKLYYNHIKQKLRIEIRYQKMQAQEREEQIIKNLSDKNIKIPTLVYGEKVANTDQQKENILNENYCNMTNNLDFHDGNAPHYKKIMVDNYWNLQRAEKALPDALSKEISREEITRAILAVNGDASPGHDWVYNEQLKFALNQGIEEILHKLFNACLQSGYYPSLWTRAIIMPIFKNKGEKSEPKNYRPIAWISNLGKCFEKILHTRINDLLISRNWICAIQHGFRKGKGCEDVLMFLIKAWDDKLRLQNKKKNPIKGQHTLCFDFKKAFNSVWKERLLYKIYKAGITGKLFTVLANYLKDRQQQVKVNNDVRTEKGA